jgi:hypothetical protein
MMTRLETWSVSEQAKSKLSSIDACDLVSTNLL